MSKARRTDPDLWEVVKAQVTSSDRGGRSGQWSARKAQFAVQEYKRRGGSYSGAKSTDNSLDRWTKEDWGTRSGRDSRKTGERYLPREARRKLTQAEYDRTSDKKRSDTRKGRQHSAQPADIARKTAKTRSKSKPKR